MTSDACHNTLNYNTLGYRPPTPDPKESSLLRFLVNLLLFYFAYRLLRPVVRRAVRYVQALMGTRPADPKVGDGKYSELTPYDIEDADYEEIERNAD